MLYYTSIDTKTLELLKKLQKLDIFSGLRLVGGTALALQYGHRKSIDIDLFGKINADDIEILDNLNKIGNVNTISLTNYIKIFTLDNIKLDIVNYPYKWLEPAINPHYSWDYLYADARRRNPKEYFGISRVLQRSRCMKIIPRHPNLGLIKFAKPIFNKL